MLYNGGHSRLIRDVTAFRLKESFGNTVLCTVHRCQYYIMGKKDYKNGTHIQPLSLLPLDSRAYKETQLGIIFGVATLSEPRSPILHCG